MRSLLKLRDMKLWRPESLLRKNAGPISKRQEKRNVSMLIRNMFHESLPKSTLSV